jgi:hypothetical protein
MRKPKLRKHAEYSERAAGNVDSDITTCTSDLTHEVVENEVGILVAHEQTGADKRRPLSLDGDLPVGDVLMTSWSHSYTRKWEM